MIRSVPRLRGPHSTLHVKRRAAHNQQAISDTHGPTTAISLARSANGNPPPTHNDATLTDEQNKSLVRSSVPSTINSDPRASTRPPFHTHAFFAALEKTFPTPTARSLMRATRALLIDRIGKVRREGLTTKDLENVGFDVIFCNPLIMLIASLFIPCCVIRAARRNDDEYKEQLF